MKLNDILHGFKVVRVRESEELKGTLYEMEHLKTGAQLAWLDNGNENKLFSATFKTLPWDDTGVFHILEHSVLAGSDNYPVKEPFLDLIKSSMNTFLNAMTFPDKTMYPVSSRNEQDFINLTRVYLDAVFRPAIYHNDSIFRQEGWHYEVEDGEPFYNGVVYNEMKGAFASVDTIIEEDMMRCLYPDNTYGFVSGGDPVSIPDLTYGNFLRAHREFYSPSNCRFYLDGDLPLEKVLAIIGDEYLSTFAKDERVHHIPLQQPVKSCDVTRYYEIGKEEDESKKSHLALGKVFADWNQRERIIAYILISTYLAGDNESPLKRAILEKGLAQDVEFAVIDGVAQPFWLLIFRNMDASDKEAILKTYRETLENILSKGVDKDALTGGLNRFEFSLREPSEPTGLTRAINAMNSWLYGGDPMLYLESNDVLRDLREALDSDLYEKIIAELLDETGLVNMTVLPSRTKGDEDAEREYRRVTAEYGALDEEQLKEVRDIYDRMRNWQDTPDSEDAVATLPVLALEDVSLEPQWVEPRVSDVNGVTFLYEPIFTNGVVHVNMYFNVSDLTDEELQMMSCMTEFLGLLPTSRHTASELQKETRKLFGVLDYNVINSGVDGHTERAIPFFAVTFSVLEENLDPAMDLVLEILTDSDFSVKETMSENLLQAREIIYQSILGSGNRFAARRVLSNYTAPGCLDEILNGYDMLLFIRDLLDNFGERSDEYAAQWQALAKKVFVSARLTVGETSTEKHPGLERIAGGLPLGGPAPGYREIILEGTAKKEAILIPAGISFAAFGSNMHRYGFEHSGRFQVLSQIMTYGYLWDKVRVHGGAYGTNFSTGTSGNLVFTSYRDPDPLNSLNVYKTAGDFVRQYAGSDEDITKYIISSIANLDGLVSSARRGSGQEMSWFRGTCRDDVCRIRKEMLTSTKDQLLEVAALFDQAASDGSVCVIGNEEAISPDETWDVYRL